jgi:uncharacterized protein YecT (DUF1311 family)
MMLATLLWLSAVAVQPQPSGPSFPCTGALTPTETLICGDPELSANDRAMGFAYAHKLRPTDWTLAMQRAWIATRNRCGADRACVLNAYSQWIGSLDPLSLTDLTPLTRKNAPATGDDLMLGTLQSPTGSVTPEGDHADLMIEPVGSGWYLFVINATHFYNPHDGLGSNVSDAEQVGLVHLVNGMGQWREENEFSPQPCALAFTRLARGGWALEEYGTCGGIGASLAGVYR